VSGQHRSSPTVCATYAPPAGTAVDEHAGTLTGMAAGDQPITEQPVADVLDAIAATFLSGEDRFGPR
jgi:hypothetical protein